MFTIAELVFITVCALLFCAYCMNLFEWKNEKKKPVITKKHKKLFKPLI